MSSSLRWPWIAPILLYAVSALEMIIMVSPFAAYFYSVYTPLFHGLEQSAATAWLPQFFLPHLAQTRFPLFQKLELFGGVLTLVGLAGFLACAVQLYYGKFVRKHLVSGGLYGRVRHPQYLCLAVAGAGFLLMWPRFFILASYLMMLGLYYLLARHEEELLRTRYGSASDEYLARVPMFNPFRGPAPSKKWLPPARGRALLAWVSLAVISLGLAFLVRMAAVTQLYAVRSNSPNVTVLSLKARSDDGMNAIMQSVLATDSLQELVKQNPEEALFLQIATGKGQLKHLLIDSGMKGASVQAVQVPELGDFVLVSRVVMRDPGTDARPDPFAFGTRIEPQFLVQLADFRGELAVREFLPGEFYPGFARIRF